MRIVFVGAVEFSRVCLEEVLKQGGDVVGVFTLSAEGRHYNSDFSDLGPLCERSGVPCFRIGKINDPVTVEKIRELAPDLMLVLGWSQIIGSELLSIPSIGCIGSHPALLPRNRGRHPLIWALVKGLERSGLTFFYLDEGADSGDILWQREFEITPQDDASSLYARILELGRQAIREFLPQLQSGTAPRIAQDHNLATYWPKRSREDGEIRWAEDSSTVHNLIRALTRPYPGAHTYLDGREVKVWRSELCASNTIMEKSPAAPGTVVRCSGDGSVFVKTGNGILRIIEYQPHDGSELEISEGMRFGGVE